MRIKLNLQQLVPKKNPSVYWLHVDTTHILLIKQLKEKVQKVLKEFCNIELCLDNVPFLDEDDVHAINENEEITVVVKNTNNYEETNLSISEIKNFNSNGNRMSIVSSDEDSSIQQLDFIPIKHTETPPSTVLQTNAKKRVRKRTHKKKKPAESKPVESKPAELVLNNSLGTQSDTSIVTLKDTSKMHKRFKLDNENAGNNHHDNVSKSSSDEECLEVVKEVFRCDNSFLESEKPQKSKQVFKKENLCKSKSSHVPVFFRGQKCTQQTSTQNNSFDEYYDNKANISNSNENYDLLVVDWKSMTPVKISNITELQINDLIQFKTLFMNDNGPQMSSVITARLEHIYKETLHIQVLSGIKEFMVLNSKFQVDDEEENTGTEREIEFGDIFEVVKLT